MSFSDRVAGIAAPRGNEVASTSASSSARTRTASPFTTKWLFEQLDIGVEPALMDNGVLRVSRHEQDPDIGHHHLRPIGQFAAVHPRHDDVGQEQIDPQIGSGDDRQRGGGIVCLHDGVVKLPEGFDNIATHTRIVLGDKDRLACPARASVNRRALGPLSSPGSPAVRAGKKIRSVVPDPGSLSISV